jgi:hypothetical protein
LAGFLASAAMRADDKAPAPGGPVPVPYPNAAETTSSTASSAARDVQSGQPTGKRMHKPWVFSASARKLTLDDGRVFVVNAETGEVVFGDGLQGRRPETGTVPGNGRYRLGGGAAGDVEVRGGRILTPTPVPKHAPTASAAHATARVK